MHSALIGGGAQKRLLEAAYDMRLIDGSLVFVPYDALLYSLPHRNVSYPALRRSGKLLRAYDAVLTVTADSPGASFYEAYGEAVERGEVGGTWKPQQVRRGRGLFFCCDAPRARRVRLIPCCPPPPSGVSALWHRVQLRALRGSRGESGAGSWGADVRE